MKNAYSPIISILFIVLSTFTAVCQKADTIASISPYVSNGKIIRFTSFPSSFVQSRTIDVWLPEHYTPRQQYAVLYMHDGQMLFDDANTWNHQEWGMDEALQLLQDSLKPVIIVAIWNADTLRHAEYFPEKALHYMSEDLQVDLMNHELKGKALADEYLSFIVTELKPFIENAFSASRKPEDNIMMGSSMGGLISLYALCEYPELFGGIAGLSTHWIGTKRYNDGRIPQAISSYIEDHLPIVGAHKQYYFDYGSLGLDSVYKPYQDMIDIVFKKKGFTQKHILTMEFEGEDHNEDAWRNRVGIPLLFLLRKPISN